MAGNISQKDMEIISNGITDGLGTVDQLPGNVKSALFNYWDQMGIDATNPNSEITQAQLEELKAQREAQSGGIFNSPVFKPIEWIGSKLYQAYSASVSPILSAGAMAAHSIVYGRPDFIGEDGEVDALKDYWHYAHSVSPGQAIWQLGLNNEELKQRGIRPDQIAQDAELQKKGQYQDEKTASDPFGLRTRSQEYFGQGASKYVSGTTDFAVSWYADPLVLTGKTIGGLKTAGFTRSVKGEIKANEAIVRKHGPSGLTDEEVNAIAWNGFTKKSYFQSLTDDIWKVKTSSGDGAAAQLTSKFPTIAKSANGPAAARLLAQATSKGEIANVLRVTMGDAAALESLKFQNFELAYQVEGLNSRVSSIGNYYSGLSDAQKLSPFGLRVKALMDSKSQQIARLDSESRVVTDKVNAFGVIGNLNYNSITTSAGVKVRNAWEGSRSWQPLKDGGFIKNQTNNIYSLSLGGVIKLAHTYNDIKPTHFIDVADSNGWRQLNASLLEARGLTPAARDMYVSQYLNAPEAMRASALQTIEQKVAHNMVDRYNDRHGLTGTADEIHYDIADQLYREVAAKRGAAQGAIKSESFGTATVPDPANPGSTLRVDEITPDGGSLVTTPLLRTQMANGHAMMDFKLFRKALEANASTWNKARLQVGTGWEKTVGVADYVGSIWKFSQLFRLGYGPRALSDDALSQLARFGPMAMMSRAVKGGKYNVEALRRAALPGNVLEAAHVTRNNLEIHIDDLTAKQAKTQADLAKAKIEGRTADVQYLEGSLEANIGDLAAARRTYSDMDDIVKGGQAMKHTTQGAQVFGPSYAGAEGALFRDLASGEKNFANMMGSASDSYLGDLRRMDWTLLSPAKHGTDVHMNAWLKVLNQQVAHDALASQYLKGKTPQQLEAWLSSPAGLAYKADHKIAQHLPHDQLVERVAAQMDEWVNPAFPGADVIRQAASEGKVTKEMLEGVPEGNRPLVNGQALAYARGSHKAIQLMDSAMTGFYHIVGNMPARYLLRNPLFAQRYSVHLRELQQTAGKTNAILTEDMRVQFEHAARRRALDDVKKNTFTMDYETKMSHMLRNFGAFFGAQQESWNRWARIISDKPDILPRVAQAYGAPTRAGITTDQDGHRISEDGYVTDPITGERKLVDYSDRHVVIQVPDYLGGKAFKKAFGLDKDATFDIPMSTAEIILNHGDGPIPVGAGPYVQMAANNIPFTGLDANGDPKLADMYQQLGILPFGAQESNAEAWLPNWVRKMGGTDSLSDTYQANVWYIMQAEDYKYREGLRKTAPTWDEITSRANKQTWMKVLFSATLPLSLSAKDPYDFFRSQYRQMQDLDPSTADQNFYDKYGDSAFTFSQSLSKNNSGLRPTAEAVHASKYYQDLISKAGPEWAGLIVGAEGEGKYSNGAFYYERTHATDPATGETMRGKMSAREALDQSKLSLGWRQYKSYMNGLYSQLFDRGLKSFEDEGAEDLLAEKKSLVSTLSDPQTLDENGDTIENPYYNSAWSKEYNSFDTNHYDRSAASLRQIVDDPEIWSKAVNPDGSIGMRSDIYRLKTYLTYRNDVQRALILRNEDDGSDDINAESNADIKQQWNALVIALVESDTQFADLHSRYLSRDMGFDQETVTQSQDIGELPRFEGSLDQADEQSIFDVLAQQGGV
ncbi:MAG TPA: hypothetical protein VIY48_05580 [Candidatus Paceibacterota bacterium]